MARYLIFSLLNRPQTPFTPFFAAFQVDPMYQNLYTRILLLTLIAVTASVSVVSAQNTEADILAMLKQRDQDIKTLLGTAGEIPETKKEELRVVINDLIDFRAMGQAALGPHWDDLQESQKTDFVQVFGDIVRHQSLADTEVYRASVTYDQITVDGNQARVVTTTIYKEVPAQVEYDFVLADDEWRARDIILDDVSTVGGYSRSFQSVIRKKGFDALMTSLNKRLERTKS